MILYNLNIIYTFAVHVHYKVEVLQVWSYDPVHELARYCHQYIDTKRQCAGVVDNKDWTTLFTTYTNPSTVARVA